MFTNLHPESRLQESQEKAGFCFPAPAVQDVHKDSRQLTISSADTQERKKETRVSHILLFFSFIFDTELEKTDISEFPDLISLN